MAGSSKEGTIMITPEYLSDIMAAVEEKLVDVDNYLIRKIIKRIMDTFESDEFADLLIPSTKSDIRKLLKAGVLYEDVQQAVEKRKRRTDEFVLNP